MIILKIELFFTSAGHNFLNMLQNCLLRVMYEFKILLKNLLQACLCKKGKFYIYTGEKKIE